MTQNEKTFVFRVVVAIALVLTGVSYFFKELKRGSDLPVLGVMPQFSLQEINQGKWDSSFTKGKITVASFLFTTCPGQCPIIAAKLQKISQQFTHSKKVLLLSITVDPETDTVPVLQAFASQWKAKPEQWLFLRGEQKQTYDLAKEGFHLAGEKGTDSITHSSKLVLIDTEGQIRGYYDALREERFQDLLKDMGALL